MYKLKYGLKEYKKKNPQITLGGEKSPKSNKTED